jgi:hypothetical protein
MTNQILLLKELHDWVPPDGLDHARPRAVVLTMSGRVLMTIAGLLLAGGITAGVALGIVASREAREARLVDKESEFADALVTRTWRDRSEARQPWISYRFVAGGHTYTRNFKIPLRMWRGLSVGARLPVRFAATRPELNHPVDLSLGRTPAWLPFLIAFSLAIWSPIVLIPIRCQRRLLAEGRPAPGIVISHGKPQHGSHGEKRGMKYRYEFRLLSGAAAGGSAGPAKNPPPVGTKITVLYDPENPRRNTPYPIPSSMVRLSY